MHTLNKKSVVFVKS